MSVDFKVLDDIAHVLIRPSMYIGATTKETSEVFIRGKRKQVTIVPGLRKIAEEIIDNVVDVQIRENLPKIRLDVTLSPTTCKVSDNGPGIPVVMHEEAKKLLPVLAWTTLKAGTSFVENREGPSANGVGSSLTCIFSKKFEGETCDGKNYCKVTSQDNCQKIDVFKKAKKGSSGTTVTFQPDFSRFEVSEFTPDHIDVIRERLYAIASTFPEIQISFNGEKIKPKNYKEYLSTFGDSFIEYQGQDYFFGIFNSPYEEYAQASNINSLDFMEGGTHEELIMQGITYALKEQIKKKHKLEMAPAEIKRCLMFVFAGRKFKNLKFSGQTKTKVKNSVTETKDYLDFSKIPFDKLAKKILATPEIIDPIIQSKLAKQAAIDARAVTLAQKKLNQAKVKKHVPANSRNPKERELFLCEGDSALGRLKEVRNPKTQGGFALRGKPLNVYGMPDKDILENKEFKNLLAITGLKLHMSDAEVLMNLQYHSVNILTDADIDGLGHILPLLINFFSRWKILFERGIVKVVQSPILIMTKGKQKVYLYSLNDYKDNLDKWKGWKPFYCKGLGSLEEDDYEYVLNDNKHKIPISLDKPEILGIMFGDDVEKRKKFLLGDMDGTD